MLCLITQLCPTLCDPMDCSPPGSSVHGILQERILEWVAMPSSRGSSHPRSPALQADSLPSEPPGEPKNTGVDSLSFLQGNFLTQGSNQGLLHYREILYQLSYQGSPGKPILPCKYLDSFACLKDSSDELGDDVAAKSLQSCPTLCDPIDSSPPGSPVPGILQARTLEWVAISFSNA